MALYFFEWDIEKGVLHMPCSMELVEFVLKASASGFSQVQTLTVPVSSHQVL